MPCVHFILSLNKYTAQISVIFHACYLFGLCYFSWFYAVVLDKRKRDRTDNDLQQMKSSDRNRVQQNGFRSVALKTPLQRVQRNAVSLNSGTLMTSVFVLSQHHLWMKTNEQWNYRSWFVSLSTDSATILAVPTYCWSHTVQILMDVTLNRWFTS